METRESLARKFSSWKNQKAYADTNPEYEDTKKVNREDIMAELAGKMNGMVIDQKPNEPKMKKQEIRFEKTFAQEMESHNCPICLEMMLPPNNPPMILFPCGHTFCKTCINTVSKQTHNYNNRNKCPLCKTTYKDRAINIALQNQICIYTDNKQLQQSNVIDQAQEDTEENEKNNTIKLNSLDYENRLKDLDMRLRIMTEEKQKMEIEMHSCKSNLDSLTENVLTYKQKRTKVDKKMKQYVEQRDVLENYIVSASQQIGEKENQISSNQEKVSLLKDTISNLETERIKVNILLNEGKFSDGVFKFTKS